MSVLAKAKRLSLSKLPLPTSSEGNNNNNSPKQPVTNTVAQDVLSLLPLSSHKNPKRNNGSNSSPSFDDDERVYISESNITELYNAALGLEEDGKYKDSLELYKRLVDYNSHPQSAHNLACLLQEGKGSVASKAEPLQAIKYFAIACESELKESQYSLACLLKNHLGDYEEAFGFFQLAANQDHIGAAYNLGVILEKGRGLNPVDRDGAISYYRFAASKGHVKAAVNLAAMLSVSGSDSGSVSSEKGEVDAWLRMAVDRGDPNALFNASIVARDCGEVGKCVELLGRAAEAGHVSACYNLAKAKLVGEGCGELLGFIGFCWFYWSVG